jgi:hypothetical protein
MKATPGLALAILRKVRATFRIFGCVENVLHISLLRSIKKAA